MLLDDIIDDIRLSHRKRCFAMEQRKRLDLALGAFLRLMLGWRRDLPEKERNKIAKAAAALIEANGHGSPFEATIAGALAARKPFAEVEAGALRDMQTAAMALPIWAEFCADIRGFGPASLAVIVAEAGDLSQYSTHSKLWKRMGVAVMGDVRQGGLGRNASAEKWIEHGYSGKRRSLLWNIGDALIKGNRDGRYRTAYLRRKEYEIARNPLIKPIVAHARAQRYMEKKLLRDLWNAWRRARQALPDGASMAMPAVKHSDDVRASP